MILFYFMVCDVRCDVCVWVKSSNIMYTKAHTLVYYLNCVIINEQERNGKDEKCREMLLLSIQRQGYVCVVCLESDRKINNYNRWVFMKVPLIVPVSNELKQSFDLVKKPVRLIYQIKHLFIILCTLYTFVVLILS